MNLKLAKEINNEMSICTDGELFLLSTVKYDAFVVFNKCVSIQSCPNEDDIIEFSSAEEAENFYFEHISNVINTSS